MNRRHFFPAILALPATILANRKTPAKDWKQDLVGRGELPNVPPQCAYCLGVHCYSGEAGDHGASAEVWLEEHHHLHCKLYHRDGARTRIT